MRLSSRFACFAKQNRQKPPRCEAEQAKTLNGDCFCFFLVANLVVFNGAGQLIFRLLEFSKRGIPALTDTQPENSETAMVDVGMPPFPR